MINNPFPRNFRIIAGAGVSFLLGVAGPGCNATNNDPEVCVEYACPQGYTLYTCGVDLASGQPRLKCHDIYSDAVSWCAEYEGESAEASLGSVPCSDNLVAETGETGGGGVSPWSPSSYVTYNSTTEVYEIDEQFVQALVEDGFVQLGLDSARLDLTTSGYLKVVSLSSGDLLDELGLQTNDVLKTINGYDLNTLEDQIDAYVALKSETEFRLTIDRGGSTVTLDYEIVP